MSSKPRVLVIDDEPQIHRFLAPALTAAGYQPLRAETGAEGLAMLATRPPDALILDLGLPDLDGKVVLERARAFFNGAVLILSARDREMEKIDALDMGADDYVQKPFRIGEFLARLRAAIRNKVGRAVPTPVIFSGNLQIDLIKHLVVRAGQVVKLSQKEYQILSLLVEAGGGVMTHRQLLTAVWGEAAAENTQHLRVFIQHIRQKIEDDPSSPLHVVTAPGVGYRFNP